MEVSAQPRVIAGVVVDARSGEPLVGASVVLYSDTGSAPLGGTNTDATGHFQLPLPVRRPSSPFAQGSGGDAAVTPPQYRLQITMMGYVPAQQRLDPSHAQHLEVALEPHPLLMDEQVVRARRPAPGVLTPAFVEVLQVDASRAGLALPELLDEAVGVNIRSSGGLGSFSTVSIRGSTAEQVQVFLDGVPLNQASGGGVDMGDLPVAGVASVEIYRGAVPARFGGNSIGGVVHIRTRELGARRRFSTRVSTGAWGARSVSCSAAGGWSAHRYLGMVEYSQSRNDFTFLDDNGTEYNPRDDEWTRRLNNDMQVLRTLAKVDQPLGGSRLELRHTFQIKHQGIPNISNNQSLSTRLDKWRSVAEAELAGSLPHMPGSSYHLTLYSLRQQYEFRDLQGTVGVGHQHDRNRTRGSGARGEISTAVRDHGALTLFGALGREAFHPRSLLRVETNLPASFRHKYLGGWEADLPVGGDRVQLTVGSQWEVIRDRFAGSVLFGPSVGAAAGDNTQWLSGRRLGARSRLGRGWELKGHVGLYQRAPDFYELFGDRGAVVGNAKLRSEEGHNWDLGLVWRSPSSHGRLSFVEFTCFRNQVDDLIRFLQNSQRVSRPANIGRARIRGSEFRARARLLTWLRVSGNYTYQRPENCTGASYERGNDLPNSPRHTANLAVTINLHTLTLRYEYAGESRHYLDKANLNSVPARQLHGLGVSWKFVPQAELALDVRNMTNSQVADLWGYPLPGRSTFLALRYSMESGSH